MSLSYPGVVYDRLVTERPVTRLEDLPAFRDLRIVKASETELVGVSTRRTKAGHKLAEDAVPTWVDESGWDHEHCASMVGRL